MGGRADGLACADPGARNPLALGLFCIFVIGSRRLIRDEKFPRSFDRTTLHQIYKGKGSREVLSNSRFIHCKEWLPRTCDFLVVDKMKPYIVKGTSKFQIGGMEKHRPQEHLFVVKSILGLFANLGKNIIVQLYDITKEIL